MAIVSIKRKLNMTVYFDSAASYPVLPEVAKVLSGAYKNVFANPSSQHELGEQAALEIEHCRNKIADSIGAAGSEVIFTSGATESNNLALKGHFSLGAKNKGRHFVISAIEHKCVHAIADYLHRTFGIEISLAVPNDAGVITSDAVENALRPDTELVSVMHVNNELGTTNPIEDIGALCFQRGIKFHTDAAQSFLKSGIDVDAMNIDYASFSAHKIGGPKGIGAVYIRDQRKLHLEPTIHGAGQEEGLRGGTMAAPLIMGFSTAIEQFPTTYHHLTGLEHKKRLLEALQVQKIAYRVNGEGIASIVSLTLPNTDVQALLLNSVTELALATGSACSSKEIEPSHVLTSMGLSTALAEKTLRLSFHEGITPQQIDALAGWIKRFS